MDPTSAASFERDENNTCSFAQLNLLQSLFSVWLGHRTVIYQTTLSGAP